MAFEESDVQAGAARVVEGPPGLGAWLGESHTPLGQPHLEWQLSCSNQPQHQLRQVIPPKVIFNPTIEEDARSIVNPQFSLARLRTAADFIDTRDFDAYVPHEDLLNVLLREPDSLAKRTIFPGSSVCSGVGVVPLGETAVTHFYVVGTVTGRRGNQLSVLLPQDTITTSKRWSSAPTPEHESLVIAYPTPILDVKVHSTPKGNIFGIRTQSLLTLLPFIREDELRGVGDIRHFHWQKPLHLGTECFAGQNIADFCLNPFPLKNEHLRSDALIVDVTGGLWQTRPGAIEAIETSVVSSYAGVEQLRVGCENDGRSSFARITYGKDYNTAVIARENAVRVFDLEDHHFDFTLFMLPDSKTRILDMAQPTRQYSSTPYRVICTTEEVIWLDLEKPDVPALRIKHFRDNDDTLSLQSAFCEGLCHTFLWSRKTSAVTVYTHPVIGPIQLVLPPYDLPPPCPNMHRSGLTTIQTSMKQRYKAVVPETLILIESATDGTVYQRELISQSAPNLVSNKVEQERVEHKRIAADQPLSHLPQQDPKRLRVAHLFMLYNRLFSNQPSLRKHYTGTSRLEYMDDKVQDDLMHIPIELTEVASDTNEEQEVIPTSATAFTSAEAVDGSSVSVEAIKRELDRLSLTGKADFSFEIAKELLGHVSTNPDDPIQTSKVLQALYACSRHRKSADVPSMHMSATEAAHRFACDQIAVDLALSRDVLSVGIPLAPLNGVVDRSMSSYDRLADLPNIEYGYFKPVRSDGDIPTSDAERALLSEWTLGANPAVRPPFKNPYSQQLKEEKIANTQLKAFKTRIATGAGVSASQPAPGAGSHRPSRPFIARLPSIGDREVSLGNDEPEVSTQPRAGVQAQTQILSSTQADTQPMPFTQMLPGAHGGRPAAKKKKKRAGGF